MRALARAEYADKLGQRHNLPWPGGRFAFTESHRHICHHRMRRDRLHRRIDV